MLIFNESGHLSNELIEKWTENAAEACRKFTDGQNKSMIKIRFSIEEVLINFLKTYGNDTVCHIKGVKSRNGVTFMVSQKGLRQNPLDTNDDLEMQYNLLERLNLKPVYSYNGRTGHNRVSIPVIPAIKKNHMLRNLIIALILALLTGFFSKYIPGNILEEYIAPTISLLFKKLTSVFAALATPLVFCAVISGISDLSDVSSFGKLGTVFLRRMMYDYGIAMVVMVLLGIPFGLVAVGASSDGANVFSQLLSLILDIIPSNLIEPFLTDNDLQVVVLAIFIGVTLLAIRDKAPMIKDFVAEAGTLINRMMMTVCKFLPLLVFLGISDLMLGKRLENVGNVAQILIISLSAQIITIAIILIRTLIITKVPLKELFAAQLPSLMINITTSSQVSALPESMICCKRKFRIDNKMVDFALPFGIVIYMPNGAIVLGTIVWVLSTMTSGPLDILGVIKLAVIATIVAIAAPPIPGSALAVLPIIFSACGTDLSLMPLAVIVASTVGYLLPAMNGYCLQLELFMTATKTGMIKNKTAQSSGE